MTFRFRTPYQEFIYKRTYSRWLDDENRRETWDDTVKRYAKFFYNKEVYSLPPEAQVEYNAAIEAIYNLQVMPSMRCLWTAGPALEREHIGGYNCSYVAVNNQRVFAEALYILMCGTGLGFSVERQDIINLPTVPSILVPIDYTIVFEDSKLGWAEGIETLINMLYEGAIPQYDLSKIRAKGERLKVFGGRASGPAPLEQLIKFIIRTFQSAQSRKLTSVECHDIMCTIANSVVVGGVRRSATISLSNLSDDRMRHAKDGEFWLLNPQRSLANNSVAYTEKPECTKFIEEWLSLIRSNAGERGIFNREGAQKQQALLGRDPGYPYGTNPCGEIILKSEEFCNLTEVVIRSEDTIEDLKRKISQATLLGCLQATLTDFNFLRDTWKFNVEEERLLGVSLTGILDHPVFNGKQPGIKSWLKAMKREAILSATKWASLLGINTPKAITCVKPSGTVSQLVDSASGIHPRWSPYYIRRVRVSSTDPLAKLLIAAGVQYNPEVGQELCTCSTYVFDFPIKSPDTACYRNELNAIQQLEIWKIFKNYWCDHNPSVTIYVKEDEWLSVGTWVYTNWDFIGGLTFLPVAGGSYPLQPYEEITEETYNTLMSTFPELDFTQLSKYELEDSTHGSREFACTSGVCELI